MPSRLRKNILQRNHYNHMGIEKSQLRARYSVNWPCINNDIHNLVSNCE